MIRGSEIGLQGAGIIDKLKSANEVRKILQNLFTHSQYQGELHLSSPELRVQGKPFKHSFTGPRTKLDKRLDANGNPLPNSLPISQLDSNSLQHDKAYQAIKDLKDTNKISKEEKKKLIHQADKAYIEANKQITNNLEPMATKVASKLIETKMKLEEKGLPTNVFSGFGENQTITLKQVKKATRATRAPPKPDPIKRLKNLAKKAKTIPINPTPESMPVITDSQHVSGGFAFLPAILGAVAAPLVNKLIDAVSNKLKGNGVKPIRILKKHPIKLKKEMLAKEMEKLSGSGILDLLKPVLGALGSNLLNRVISKIFDKKSKDEGLRGSGKKLELQRLKGLGQDDKLKYIESLF